MTNPELDQKSLDVLKEKQDDDNKRFSEILTILEKYEKDKMNLTQDEILAMFKVVFKEIKDLNGGVGGSFELIHSLIKERDTIGEWLKRLNEDNDLVLKVLDSVTKKIEEFDTFIQKYNDTFDGVKEIKKSHNEILEFRNELLKIVEKRKNEPMPKLTEFPDYIK